jgi:hypothetical protein
MNPLRKFFQLRRQADKLRHLPEADKPKGPEEWTRRELEIEHLLEQADLQVRKMTPAERVQAGLLRRDEGGVINDN